MSARRPIAQTTLDAAFAFAVTQASFTIADVQLKMGVSEDLARNIVRRWRDQDLLEEVLSGHRVRSVWKVKPGARIALAAKARSPEQNMWTAMRQMRSGFTPRDLAAHATTEETLVTPDAAQDYCRALLGAEYLGVARKAVPGKTEAIYRLIRNTGPRAPRPKRVRAVVDDNTEQTILIGGGQ
jgi:hypothetical protein